MSVVTQKKYLVFVLLLMVGVLFALMQSSAHATDSCPQGIPPSSHTGSTYSSGMSGEDPFSVLAQYAGNIDYVVIGDSESTTSVPGHCGSEQNGTSETLDIPSGASIIGAYLNWSGVGSRDNSVTLNGNTVNAERTYGESMSNGGSTFRFWSASADVSNIVTGGGSYKVDNLSWSNTSFYCGVGAAYGGWSLTVVYEESSLPYSQINIYEGHRQQWPEGYMTHTLGSLDIDACGKTEITGVIWDADHYKKEKVWINDVRFGGDNPYSSQTATDLDIDTYDITNQVHEGDNNVEYTFYGYAQHTQYGNAIEGATNTVFVIKEEKCECPKGSIGDTVWFDDNGDGVQNGDEDGIAGVVVNLIQNGAVIGSDVTDADGKYLFDELPQGTYTVEVVEATLPDDIQQTYDADGLGTPNESVYNLDAGETNLEQDFGYQLLGAIGDTVWFDDDADGVQNGEDGIADVTVNLIQGGAVIDSDVTDADGKYLFDELPQGTYTVEVVEATLPDDIQQTYDADGLGTPNESVYNLDAGETNLEQDFGYQLLGAIGDTVWFDDDADGVQNGEDGIADVTVNLIQGGAVIDSDVTDADGKYLFDELPQGTYTVEVVEATLPDDIQQTYDADGLGTPNESVYNLDAGETNLEQDFGYVPLLTLGSTVFLDNDNSGTQETGEDGIADVVVALLDDDSLPILDEAGNPITTVTDEEGNYLFTGLLPGDYQLLVSAPDDAPLSSEPTSDTPNDNTDGDDNGIQENPGDPAGSTSITLSVGDEPTDEPVQGGDQDDAADTNGNMTVDFGFVPYVSLGSTVFSDNNNDGLQEIEAGETGIEDVIVELVDLATDDVIASTTTDENGDYFFDELLPGDYEVVVTPPDEAPLSSVPTATTDDNVDGDDNGSQDAAGDPTTSPTISLLAGSEPEGESFQGGDQDDAADAAGDMTVDFGFVPYVSLGSTVFADDDNSGTQDTGEDGIAGIEVELVNDDTGVVVASTVTDDNGDYLFDELLPGDYVVRVTPSITYPLSSEPTATTDDNVDGDDNGIQAAAGDTVTSPVITLLAGSEPVGEAEQGGAQDAAADANGDMTVDFGFVPYVSLGSTVFLDADDNGFQSSDNNAQGDAVEPGIPGVVVELLNTDGDVLETTTTDDNGDYYFGELLPGDYVVRVTPSISYPLSSTDIATSNADNDVDGDDNGVGQIDSGDPVTSTVITLTPGDEAIDFEQFPGDPAVGTPGLEFLQGRGQDNDAAGEIDENGNMTVDFGFRPELVAVGNFIWFDDNKDGVQDGGVDEPGIDGVTVQLVQDGEVISETVTAEGGFYLFDELAPGTYQIVIPSQFDTGESLDGLVNSLGQADPDDSSAREDDNGIDAFAEDASPIVQSALFELVYEQEPTGDGDPDVDRDPNSDFTIDFGFHPENITVAD